MWEVFFFCGEDDDVGSFFSSVARMTMWEVFFFCGEDDDVGA